jgi:hypothetical protein
MHNAVLTDWIKARSQDAELVMSVCTGALLLAKAGLLDGLEATTHHHRVPSGTRFLAIGSDDDGDDANRMLAEFAAYLAEQVGGVVEFGCLLLECLQLRVKDLDGGNNVIMVRQGKGNKDRRTMFPESVKPAVREHLRRVKALHERDLARGLGAAPLPEAFERKAPAASREFCWQFIFPASTICDDPRTGQQVGFYLHQSAVAGRDKPYWTSVLESNIR